jgi:hypothetical protein
MPRPSSRKDAFPRLVAVVSLSLLLNACNSSRPAPIAESAEPKAKVQHVEWVTIPKGADPTTFVRAERSRSIAAGKKLLVYVGATWCEPCQYFHDAASSGQLDAQLGDLRLIELDNDKNEAEIAALGCESKMIPLFALPDDDGRCSSRRVEGGIKGSGAVPYLTPKIRELVGP